MIEMKLYEVYIQTENGYIIAVNSSEFLSDTSGWVKIDEGYGDKYHHAQGNYFPEALVTEVGAYRYMYTDEVIALTAEEIAEQEAAIIEAAEKAAEEAYKNSPEYRVAQLEAMLEALTGVKA